ncbi:rCG41026 [Rattus norvegicus]|uniref:RCG41026 n=1 Tax=Rattus norvegicus TaxID=10116 RepID=A6K218_RAT|nr:rCG41026 [Rattus norvegicus]
MKKICNHSYHIQEITRRLLTQRQDKAMYTLMTLVLLANVVYLFLYFLLCLINVYECYAM